jgi:uncharacterized membrane-anchored protein YhcB (DUF1043 family)
LAHKQLEEQSRRLLREFQKQAAILDKLKHTGEDLLRLDTDDQGAVLIDEADGEVQMTDLLAEIERAMQGR